jgi:hypothetical protein
MVPIRPIRPRNRKRRLRSTSRLLAATQRRRRFGRRAPSSRPRRPRRPRQRRPDAHNHADSFRRKDRGERLGHRIALKGPGNGTATILDGNLIQIGRNGQHRRLGAQRHRQGPAQLGNVTVNGDLKSFSGKTADLLGNVTFTGTLGKFAAHNASGGHSLNIGGTPRARRRSHWPARPT